MQSAEIVAKNFKDDLKSLLEKYNAEFDVIVEMREFGPFVEGIEIYIPTKYDGNDIIAEGITINLTKWFDCNSI
jgi:hypothetical protein